MSGRDTGKYDDGGWHEVDAAHVRGQEMTRDAIDGIAEDAARSLSAIMEERDAAMREFQKHDQALVFAMKAMLASLRKGPS